MTGEEQNDREGQNNREGQNDKGGRGSMTESQLIIASLRSNPDKKGPPT